MSLAYFLGWHLEVFSTKLLTLEALEGVRSCSCRLWLISRAPFNGSSCDMLFFHVFPKKHWLRRVLFVCCYIQIFIVCSIRMCVVIGLSQTVPMWPCRLHYELMVISTHRLVPLGMFLNISTCLVISKLVGIHTPCLLYKSVEFSEGCIHSSAVKVLFSSLQALSICWPRGHALQSEVWLTCDEQKMGDIHRIKHPCLLVSACYKHMLPVV